MPINTNGWTIYAPEGTTIEQIIDAFMSDKELWSKVVESTLFPYTGVGPEEWVREHTASTIVYTTGRDKDKIRQRRAKKVICKCGCSVNYSSLSRHQLTKIHLEKTNSL